MNHFKDFMTKEDIITLSFMAAGGFIAGYFGRDAARRSRQMSALSGLSSNLTTVRMCREMTGLFNNPSNANQVEDKKEEVEVK